MMEQATIFVRIDWRPQCLCFDVIFTFPFSALLLSCLSLAVLFQVIFLVRSVRFVSSICWVIRMIYWRYALRSDSPIFANATYDIIDTHTVTRGSDWVECWIWIWHSTRMVYRMNRTNSRIWISTRINIFRHYMFILMTISPSINTFNRRKRILDH